MQFVRWKNYWGIAALVFFIGGLALMASAMGHNRAYTWYPLNLPLTPETTEALTGTFTAEVSQQYELELQFSENVPTAVMTQHLLPLHSAPLDLTWSVTAGDAVIAQGDSVEYLYLANQSMKRRLWNRLLSAPDDFGVLEGNLVRGIGAFPTEAGKTYHVLVTVREIPDVVHVAQPALAVRINRQFSNRHYGEKAYAGGAGIFSVLIAFPLAALWLVATWLTRRNAP